MEIKVNLDLSRYSREELHQFARDGVISVKELMDELHDRHVSNLLHYRGCCDNTPGDPTDSNNQ